MNLRVREGGLKRKAGSTVAGLHGGRGGVNDIVYSVSQGQPKARGARSSRVTKGVRNRDLCGLKMAPLKRFFDEF
jgi:hypothetical protein